RAGRIDVLREHVRDRPPRTPARPRVVVELFEEASARLAERLIGRGPRLARRLVADMAYDPAGTTLELDELAPEPLGFADRAIEVLVEEQRLVGIARHALEHVFDQDLHASRRYLAVQGWDTRLLFDGFGICNTASGAMSATKARMKRTLLLLAACGSGGH